MNNERQEYELELNGIEVIEYSFGIDKISFCCVLNGKKYIAINSDAKLNIEQKYWIIEHELEHIKNNAFYMSDSEEYRINQYERMVDDLVVLKNGLLNKENVNAPASLLEHAAQQRKEYEYMKNCVNLLCIKHNIGLLELSYKLGISEKETEDILFERAMIQLDTLERLSEMFDVTNDYILCK